MTPSHAATIWIGSAGELRLGLPASTEGGQDHSVILRADAAGMGQLIQILAARLQAPSATKIGHKAVPTQALADALARGDNAEKLAAHKAKLAEAKRIAEMTTGEFLDEFLNEGDLL